MSTLHWAMAVLMASALLYSPSAEKRLSHRTVCRQPFRAASTMAMESQLGGGLPSDWRTKATTSE